MTALLLGFVLLAPVNLAADESLGLLQGLSVQRMREGHFPSVFRLSGRSEIFQASGKPLRCHDLPLPGVPENFSLPNAIEWFSTDLETSLSWSDTLLSNMDQVLQSSPRVQLQALAFVTYSIGNMIALRPAALPEPRRSDFFRKHLEFSREFARNNLTSPEDVFLHYDDVGYVLSIVDSLAQNAGLKRSSQEWVTHTLLEITGPMLSQYRLWEKHGESLFSISKQLGLTRERLVWTALLLYNSRIRLIGSVFADHVSLIDEMRAFEDIVEGQRPELRSTLRDVYYRTLMQYLVGALNSELQPTTWMGRLPFSIYNQVLNYLTYLEYHLVYLRQIGFVPSPSLEKELASMAGLLLQRPEAHRLAPVTNILVFLRGDRELPPRSLH